MIYVTHDQVEAMTLATRIVVMRAGRIQQIGSPHEVYERPDNLFVAGFLGAPGINLIKSRIKWEDGGVTLDAPFVLDLGKYVFKSTPRQDQDVVVGIRPEHLHLTFDGEFEGRVQLVEPMGNHQVVWIDCGGQTLSAVVHEDISLQPDAPLRFDIEVGRLSLFDPDSELRL
jgi:multiple sugar transport system ATP-binding protein